VKVSNTNRTRRETDEMFMKDDAALVIRRAFAQLLAFAKRSDSDLDDIREGLCHMEEELNGVRRDIVAEASIGESAGTNPETMTGIDNKEPFGKGMCSSPATRAKLLTPR
jgi:hypothetical protein